MKVLLVGKFYSPFKGGMESALQELAEGLVEKGHEVLCLVSNTSFQHKEEVMNGVKVCRLPTMYSLLSVPLTFWSYKPVKIFAPDIIHVHVPNPLALLFFSFYRGCKVVTIHSNHISYKFLNYFHQLFSSLFFLFYQQLVFTSKAIMGKKTRAQVIPLGVNPVLSLPKGRKFPTTKNILFIGRLVKYKGLRYLEESCREKNYSLSVVGNDNERSIEEDKFSSIDYLGELNKEELREVLERSDVLVLPSISPAEAFGLVLLEGLSAGLPLVTTDLRTGVTEINEHLKTGLVVPVKNSKRLGEAIESIFSDKNRYSQFSNNGIEKFCKLYTRDKMVEKHEKMYEELLK